MPLSTINTLALLRITPLITSSASLFYCGEQHLLFSSFISPPNQALGAKLLPGFWGSYITPSLGFIFGLYSTSALSGFINAYGLFRNARAPQPAAKLYAIGAGLSLAHFLFAPIVAVHIDAMMNDEEGLSTVVNTRKWLSAHRIRSLLVDFPGWLCFLTATCNALIAL